MPEKVTLELNLKQLKGVNQSKKRGGPTSERGNSMSEKHGGQKHGICKEILYSCFKIFMTLSTLILENPAQNMLHIFKCIIPHLMSSKFTHEWS